MKNKIRHKKTPYNIRNVDIAILYSMKLTGREIALRYGISPLRVKQIHSAYKKLSVSFCIQSLSDRDIDMLIEKKFRCSEAVSILEKYKLFLCGDMRIRTK